MKNIKIIYADDFEENHLIFEMIARPNNWEVDFVFDGIEVIDMLEKNKYDIIILDYMMPELDGIQTAKIIRENANYDNIPIIIISAFLNDEVIDEIENIGINDYIKKPFSREEIISKVEKLEDLR